MNVQIEESWKQHLAPEFEKDYFIRLTEFVRSEYQTATIYPPGRFIFNAFNLCPFDKVKVVIIGQDPYHGPGQAHGLCFSVNDGVPFPPSLQNIFKEIQSDLGAPIPTSGNLTRWANQGVLLLNATLTVRAHQAGSQTISHFFIPNFFLVPIHRTTRIASLIPFQSIGQHTGVSTNTEVIGSKGTEYQATAHIETVQVTADIDRCH